MKSWELGIIISVALVFVFAFVGVCILYRWHLNRRLNKKEEEIRIAYEAESKSLPMSPVRRFLAINPARSSSGSLTGEFIFRGKVGSYGDDFAHISIPLDRKWEINREQLRIDGQLGEGAFGRVLKATALGVPGIPQKHTVAIKTLKGEGHVLKEITRYDWITPRYFFVSHYQKAFYNGYETMAHFLLF